MQGTDTVASMVVWKRPHEEIRLQKIYYSRRRTRGSLRIIDDARWQNDDFASMREAVSRRYRRLQEEKKLLPGLILIDGGIGQLHAAAQALDSLQIINQAAGQHRQKRRNSLRLRPGKRTRHSRPSFTGSSPHPANPRRNASVRRNVHRQRRGKRQTTSALLEIPVSVQKPRNVCCANLAALPMSAVLALMVSAKSSLEKAPSASSRTWKKQNHPITYWRLIAVSAYAPHFLLCYVVSASEKSAAR